MVMSNLDNWNNLLEDDTKGEMKDQCPHCEKFYKDLDRHVKTCKSNPKNKKSDEIKTIDISDFNSLIKFCESHFTFNDDGCLIESDDYDIDILQFYKHTISRELYRKRFHRERGGGGWSGSVKCLLIIQRKMNNFYKNKR